jgi:adenylate cyclase
MVGRSGFSGVATREPWRTGPAVPANLRRQLLSLVLLGLMVAMCAPLFADRIDRNAPAARAGVVSFARFGPLVSPVELGGEWRLTWHGGAASDIEPGSRLLIPIPGQWNALRDTAGKPLLPGSGAASFELTIEGLRPGLHLLHVPILYGAARVSIDGRLLAQGGRFSLDPRTAVSAGHSYDLPIDATGRPVTLRIDLAAYHHRNTGLREAPILGRSAAMQAWIAFDWTRYIVIAASLLLLAANSAIAFIYRQRDKAAMWGAIAFACSIPPVVAGMHDDMLLVAMPFLSFRAMLTIEYVSAILVLPLYLIYARALFPLDSNKWLFWPILAVELSFLIVQLVTLLGGDTLAASRNALYWPPVAALPVIGTLSIVATAAWRGRGGALMTLVGLIAFGAGFINTSLAKTGAVPPDFGLGANALPMGMVALLFSQAIVIAERWSRAVTAEEETNRDLRELVEVNSAITSEVKLDSLLSRIVEGASRLLRAERSSLLLYDEKSGTLRSVIAEGLGQESIEIPQDTGLAGHAFTSGSVINVPVASADPRFRPDIDAATGYRTRSILSMPVTTGEGRRLGVMQALNRREGGVFSELDEERLAAFVAQSAIAIDNATLFSDVAAARNYNESILRSMATGVITIGRDGLVGKVNEAALRILELPETGIEGYSARRMLARGNAPLVAEIDAVERTGEPALLMDIDVVTAKDNIISINLSIVPLRGEEGASGVLLLFEDISSEKRVRTTMARYMSKDVAEQLLHSDSDELGGKIQEVSILFADLRGFTSFAESQDARETVALLNRYFTEMVDVIMAFGGTLDKYIGDAIMALFGAPFTAPTDAMRAVAAANEMVRALARFNAARAAEGDGPLQVGIGISTGDVVLGNIGSAKRMEYTVIGDSVNLASRVESATKHYGTPILFSEFTRQRLDDDGLIREIDLVRVKGRDRAVRLYETLAWRAGDAGLEPFLDVYNAGRAAFVERDWALAAAAFERALGMDPGDGPSRLHLDRARDLQASPPPPDWDGAWTLA